MYKILCCIIISNAVLICAQSSGSEKANENSFTTEIYETRHEENSVKEVEKTQNTELVTDNTKLSEDEPNNTASSNMSTVDNIETLKASVPTSTPTPKFNRKEAEAEIKSYSDKLDCNTSTFGEFKCTMLKKLVRRFFENAEGVESKKLTVRIKSLVKKFEESDTPLDPEMTYLIKKYKKFL